METPTQQQVEQAKKVLELYEKQRKAEAFLNWDLHKGLIRSKSITANYEGKTYKGFQYSNSAITTLLIKGDKVLKTAWEGVKIVSAIPIKQ
jgi:hypothetical protein